MTSRAARAVRWLLSPEGAGASYGTAGKKFGVTRQAVQARWLKDGRGTNSRQEMMAGLHERVRELAKQGLTATEIAAQTGMTDGGVSHLCHREEIHLTLATVNPALLERALDAIRNGQPVSTASRICGLQTQSMRRYMDKLGLRSSPKNRTFGGRPAKGQMTLSALASRMVDEQGITIGQAALAVGVSSPSVRQWRIRRGLSTRKDV